jgi:hypothetical protein
MFLGCASHAHNVSKLCRDNGARPDLTQLSPECEAPLTSVTTALLYAGRRGSGDVSARSNRIRLEVVDSGKLAAAESWSLACAPSDEKFRRPKGRVKTPARG